MIRQITATSALAIMAACTADVQVDSTATGRPSVILIIGDGLDDQQITIGRNYLVGNEGRLVIDDMPYRGSLQVQTVSEIDPDLPVYVGDSASGATAMATGVPTSEGRIGTSAGIDLDIPNIMELARIEGMVRGIVTTSRVTDATPASFMAHVEYRYCEVPEKMVYDNPVTPQDSTSCDQDYLASGGLGSIAEQVTSSEMQIVLGGGSDRFKSMAEGAMQTTIRQRAADEGFTVIDNLSELADLSADARALGLFSSGHMPVQLRGVDGRKAEYIQRDGDEIIWPESFTCEDNPEFSSMPTLAEMTSAAISKLDAYNSGFMLMVEAASIDKEAHFWRPCGSIGEVDQLNDTVSVALEYAKVHPDTLIIVASDHGQSAQLIPEISGLALQGFASEGRFARIKTPEGGIMGINYATNNSTLWEEHSGVQVPVYASGPGVKDFPPYMRQADIFALMAKHMGVGEFAPTPH